MMRNGVMPAALHIAGGRIARVGHIDDIADVDPEDVLDAGSRLVIPGLVDTHVHINEPGRTEWEGFVTATNAAAAGGVTTLLDMPLNSIPATIKAVALERKRKDAEGQCRVDVGFFGGMVPSNLAEMELMWTAGVFGFKCFMVPSGVDEFRHVSESDLRQAMPILSRLRAPLLVHAELPGPIDAAKPKRGTDARSYATYVASRPPAAERSAVQLVIDLARRYNTRVHIVHVSASETLPVLHAARASYMPVTAETCPHYLTLAAEEIPDGATEFKCAPPIRDDANRAALWDALDAGVLDCIVSDHSPCPPEMKKKDSGDFLAAWGGIASLELGLPVIWTEMRAQSRPFVQLTNWMSAAPARLFGLHHQKGRLASGLHADFVVLDEDETFEVVPEKLQQRHKVTPYAGRTLAGRVHATYVRGRLVFADGECVGRPSGRLLRREPVA